MMVSEVEVVENDRTLDVVSLVVVGSFAIAGVSAEVVGRSTVDETVVPFGS